MPTPQDEPAERRGGRFGTEHRRSWIVVLDGETHRVEVVYAAMLGWMSVFVDGQRRARGWREFQSAFGGATLACTVGGHRLDARVTQPFLIQDYAFSLSVDGQVQPGSDAQPARSQQWVIGLIGVVAIALVVLALLFIFRPLW